MATRSEDFLIAEMIDALRDKMEADYPVGSTKRDAHPKCLGLLQGHFTVADDIPDDCKFGIFQKAKTYPCWIRSSNASGSVQSDREKDFRGFAIKLMGVQGDRFSDFEKQTQDFILMSHPTMPLGTVKLFRDAVCTATKWGPIALALRFLLTGKGRVIQALTKAKKHDSSPLDIRYWSTTPYALGPHKVKYHMRPTGTDKSHLPQPLTDNYLTNNMATHLRTSTASFDFFVQFYVDDTQTPIEDAAVEWQEAVSPFIRVATLHIQQQEIDTKDRFDLAERLSFGPANSLNDHAPLGGLNRARRKIYEELSTFRHKRDGIDLFEPSANDQVG